MSEDWINEYFWHNEVVEKPSWTATVYYNGKVKSLPPKWLEEYRDTPDGKLIRFF